MSNENWKGIIGALEVVRRCSIRVGPSAFPKVDYERMKKGEVRRPEYGGKDVREDE